MKYRFVLQLDSFADDDEDMFDGKEIRTDEWTSKASEDREADLVKLFDSLIATVRGGLMQAGLPTGEVEGQTPAPTP